MDDAANPTTELLSGAALDSAIAARPFEKVTRELMEARIAETSYHRIDETVTICSIRLDNGYSVRGESACVNPRNYDETIGRSLAYRQAFDKLRPLFGFLLAEHRLMRGQAEPAV